jgi:3',5'-cyclic AMP phosphodiesterase CpdA
MYVLAHLTDPHLGPLPRPTALELAGKRAFGFLNWHRRRKTVHRTDVLDAIVRDLKAQHPDHVALTGDLVNLALPAEFGPARHFVEKLGAPDFVTLVPGNHDLYVRRTIMRSQQHWGDYMRGDAHETFPFLRRRGPLAIIGLSSAIPTAPLMATGALGPEQLNRLSDLLARLKHEELFRVVLIHHPPSRQRGDRFKRLVDSGVFRDLLKLHGADMVLHGHDHVHSVAYLDGSAHPIPVVGVPSASAATGEGDLAAYNLYRIQRATKGWRCEAITRGLRHGREGINEMTRRMLLPR